jgi:opacity protein-like surface antigen
MRLHLIALTVVASSALAAPAAGQAVRPVVFANAGLASLYRGDDRNFGTETNLGAGAGIEWRRLGVDVEFHQTIGLEPDPVVCGVVNVTCAGSAREGLQSATMVTGNVSYRFGSQRVRPYVIGSVGALRSEMVNSLTVARGGVATLSEFLETDTGLAIGVGGGLDLAITNSLSLRPEVVLYSSTAMSRANLGMTRVTVGARYRF